MIYIRHERPKDLDHDYAFVCLGRRSFGQPFRYRAWVYVCEQARKKAGTPNVHAHAFRHTCATNLAEAGMPLDALQRQLGHRHIETTQIYQTYHRTLAEKWLGADRARRISEQFVETALSIGYRDKKTLHKNDNGVLLSVLVYTGKRDPAELTKADLEGWQAQTNRSKRVARASVTCIQRVLAAMNNLGGEAPRVTGKKPSLTFGWGRTAPQMIATFERFLADMLTIRAAETVNTYRVSH